MIQALPGPAPLQAVVEALQRLHQYEIPVSELSLNIPINPARGRCHATGALDTKAADGFRVEGVRVNPGNAWLDHCGQCICV